MTADPRAINCPTCGAGQTILGGGRVATHVCPYCGSALDTHKDFKVLVQYTDLKRPDTPLRLGDTGQIQGVDFTVIGIAGWVERYARQEWRWTDHQIFSPTHGYGWLTKEYGGRWSFTRKLRQYPRHWLTPTNVETAEDRPHLWLGTERLAYYETSTAEIDYLEGAFNWQPEIGSRATSITLLGEHRMITLSGFGDTQEREVEETRLATAEELASFGIERRKRVKRHPLAMPPRWAHHRFVLTVSAGFTAAALILSTAFIGTHGTTMVKTDRLPIDQLPIELTFDAPGGANLVKVSLFSNVYNGWAFFDIGLENDDGDVMQEGGHELSYYAGRDSEGPWSEGALDGDVIFEIPGPDTYHVSVEMSEFGSGETGATRTNSQVQVRVSTLVHSWEPFFVAAIVFAAIFGVTFWRDSRRTARRLAGSDWTEDD